jgi:hypothetical protein
MLSLAWLLFAVLTAVVKAFRDALEKSDAKSIRLMAAPSMREAASREPGSCRELVSGDAVRLADA